MPKRIYVGNLPFSGDEAAVKKMFAEFGAVDSVSLETGGRAQRTAVVVMKDEAAARKALGALHGRRLGGSKLNVSEARPRG